MGDKMNYNYILWDWNGTLMDDVGLALDAVNAMLAQKEKAPIDLEAYRLAMGTPILRFYEHFFDMQSVSMDWISEQFNTYYRLHQSEYGLHAGARTVLEQYKKTGCHQIILSSSHTDGIRRSLKMYQLEPYFESVLGADNLLAESKVQRAVDFFKSQAVSPKEAVLIGDTVHDWEVAEAIGIDCILLTAGHQDRASLQQTGSRLIDHLTDLI